MSPAVLVKGQNGPLPAGPLVVTVDLTAPADLSALLVTANGKVRSDADFVFFNQPDGPGVHVRQPAAGQPWRIELDPAQLPAEIDQVRIVSNLENPAGRFGQLPAPVATVSDAAGNQLVQYQATGLDTESIVILLEIYRRADTFKVRAVGQGYAGGLADLIRDHGVTVDDAPTPPPPAAPPVPPQIPSPGQYAPPPADQPLAYLPPPVAPAPGQYAPPPMDQPPAGYAPPPAPAYLPPPAPGYAPPPPGYPAPAVAAQVPPPVPVPQPATPPQAAPAAPANPPGEVSLVKGRSVSLVKGQRVSLRKEDGAGLTLVRMGLGWDPIRKRGFFGSRETEIDLDASAVMFADHEGVDIVFYNNLQSKDGSIQHAGDNRTGAGDGDDETVMIDLPRVPAHVTTILLIVTSYEGQTFEQVQNAFCRLIDHTNGQELARYAMAGGMPYTGMVMAKLFRESGTWKMMAVGEGMQARTPLDALPSLNRFL